MKYFVPTFLGSVLFFTVLVMAASLMPDYLRKVSTLCGVRRIKAGDVSGSYLIRQFLSIPFHFFPIPFNSISRSLRLEKISTLGFAQDNLVKNENMDNLAEKPRSKSPKTENGKKFRLQPKIEIKALTNKALEVLRIYLSVI